VLGTFLIAQKRALLGHRAAVPYVGASAGSDWATPPRMAEWADSMVVVDRIRETKATAPDLVAIVRLPLGSGAAPRAVELARQGTDALHVCADWRGIVHDGDRRTHITRALRDVHLALVRQGIRDEVTLIASGGISMAEHVAKTIICGADLVAVDVPLMIALECRVCGNCQQGLPCPIAVAEINHDYAVQRIVNLMGAWHSQLVEVMGAMGMREVRRLRGEAGRAMFFEDLEKECFGPIFGERLPGSTPLEAV
jgi:hypothetical protein